VVNLRELLSLAVQPLALKYSSTRILLAVFVGLLFLGAAAYVSNACYLYQSLVQQFEQFGYRYDLYQFLMDLATYMFAAWLAFNICDLFARLYYRVFGSMYAEEPSEAKIVYYLAIAIFALAMLLTVAYGWLYYIWVPAVAILLPGIVIRTFTQQRKVGLALLCAVASQLVILPLLPVDTLLELLIFLAVSMFIFAILAFAERKKLTGFACVGVGLGILYYLYLYVMYAMTQQQAMVTSFLLEKLKLDIFRLGFTPLYNTALQYAESFTPPLFPVILVLMLALAAIPEEFLCRSVIPRVGLYLTTLIFLALHIPSRLAMTVIPFGSTIGPIIVALVCTVIGVIATATFFILAAYRACGLAGSITTHAIYNTFVYLYALGLWSDIGILSGLVIAGLIAYMVYIRKLLKSSS